MMAAGTLSKLSPAFVTAVTKPTWVVCVVLGAPWIVRTIMGPQYEAAIGILRWLAPLPALVAISNTLGVQTMLPLGMHRRFSRILLYSGLLNLTVLPPLVYFGAGEGAATADLRPGRAGHHRECTG